jgi:hypothetical protein
VRLRVQTSAAVASCRWGLGTPIPTGGQMGGLVLPATLTWGQGRYEVGIFRCTTDQRLYEESGETRQPQASRAAVCVGEAAGMASPAQEDPTAHVWILSSQRSAQAANATSLLTSTRILYSSRRKCES